MKLNHILLCAAAALSLAACNDDDNNGPVIPADAMQTIVTFAGTDEGETTFTVTEPGTTRLSEFTCRRTFPTEGTGALKSGDRLLIAYTNASGKRYQSGPITLSGYATIFQGAAAAKTQSEISPLRTDITEKQLIELSGKYVNVVLKAAANQPALFSLYFDETTLDATTPVAYVVFDSDNTNAIERVFYGSFDISDVIDRPACEGVKVVYGQGKNPAYEILPVPGIHIRPDE